MTQQRNSRTEPGTQDLPVSQKAKPVQDAARGNPAQASAQAKKAQADVQADVQAAPLPLFYQSPIALDAGVHHDVGIVPGAGGFGFARAATAIPLLANEFAAASRHYPIVFVGDIAGQAGGDQTAGDQVSGNHPSSITPLAIVGLQDGQNLFVEPDGSWKAGLYVPAYVRRYPFIVAQTDDKNQQAVLVDRQAESFVENASRHPGAWRIFTSEGKPTQAAQVVIGFCRDWIAQASATEGFGQALLEQHLLATNSADLQLAGGAHHRVEGFAIVDQARLRELSDATRLTWVKQGWYALIILHLASQQNWACLFALSASAAQKAA